MLVYLCPNLVLTGVCAGIEGSPEAFVLSHVDRFVFMAEFILAN